MILHHCGPYGVVLSHLTTIWGLTLAVFLRLKMVWWLIINYLTLISSFLGSNALVFNSTLQLSNRMVSISITMGFSAVLVWYYMYKFIAKDSKMILWGPGSLHAIFIWLGGGCCVPLCAKVNWGLGINKSCWIRRNIKNYVSFIIYIKRSSIWVQPQLSSSNSLEVMLLQRKLLGDGCC